MIHRSNMYPSLLCVAVWRWTGASGWRLCRKRHVAEAICTASAAAPTWCRNLPRRLPPPAARLRLGHTDDDDDAYRRDIDRRHRRQ